MARPYSKLRALMLEYGDTQTHLARVLQCTQAHVSALFNNRSPWRLDDMYLLMDRYGIADSELANVFPRGGRNE